MFARTGKVIGCSFTHVASCVFLTYWFIFCVSEQRAAQKKVDTAEDKKRQTERARKRMKSLAKEKKEKDTRTKEVEPQTGQFEDESQMDMPDAEPQTIDSEMW